MAKIKVCYLNVFENHLFPLTTLINKHGQSLEIFQTKVGSVGSWCWESAICLAEFCFDRMLHEFDKKRVVEIGSGTGIVGIQLAALGADVTLTDREEYLELIDYNIEKNRNTLVGHARSKSLFWGDEIPADDDSFKNPDFLIVANCVYHSIELDQLVKTIELLCSTTRKTKILACYEIRNSGIRDLVNIFHQRLQQIGFQVRFIDSNLFRERYRNDYNAIAICEKEN